MASEAAHSRKSRLSVPSGGVDPLGGAAASKHRPNGGGSRSSATATATNATTTATTATTTTTNSPVQYLARLTDVRQMDIQSALDQMRTLLSTRPQLVYKTSYYRKQTKNHWARDDPAFVALQVTFLISAAIPYAVAFKASLTNSIGFLLYTVLWNWLGMGMLIATLCRQVSNQHLVVQQSSSHVRQQVEWLYAFDIHCNAFFPVFAVLCK